MYANNSHRHYFFFHGQRMWFVLRGRGFWLKFNCSINNNWILHGNYHLKYIFTTGIYYFQALTLILITYLATIPVYSHNFCMFHTFVFELSISLSYMCYRTCFTVCSTTDIYYFQALTLILRTYHVTIPVYSHNFRKFHMFVFELLIVLPVLPYMFYSLLYYWYLLLSSVNAHSQNLPCHYSCA